MAFLIPNSEFRNSVYELAFALREKTTTKTHSATSKMVPIISPGMPSNAPSDMKWMAFLAAVEPVICLIDRAADRVEGAHDGAAGYQPGGYQDTPIRPRFDVFVGVIRLFPCNGPGENAAEQDRGVEFQGKVHAEGEGQRRHTGHAENEGQQHPESEEVPLEGAAVDPKIPTRISFIADA